MKKRGILALLLACSFAFGTVSATACNIIGGDNQQQGNGQINDGDNTGGENPDNPGGNTGGDNPDNPGDNTGGDNPDNPGDNTGGDNPDNPGDNTGGDNPDNPGGGQEPETVAVESVTLNKTSAILKVNEKVTLTANVLPENATNKKVAWNSSAPSVATVVNGVVTAVAVGNARITVTTEDGNKVSVCAVTVEASTPVTVPVSGVTVNQQTADMKAGETLQLTATVLPADATNKAVTWSSGNTAVATVDGNGVVTAISAGTATITVKSDAADYSATCQVTVRREVTDPVVDAEITYSYAGNESAAFEWADTNAANATVQYKLSTASSYTTLSAQDKQFLVRQKDPTTARVDLVGLRGGAVYEFKITTSGGEVLTVSNMTIATYDRSGYAHFGKSDGVGAYNNDGTPKSNAVIVYVNESNKNTVTAKIGGKTYTGIVSILQNAGTSTPLIVRVVGTVGAATWNKLEYNNGNPITPDAVVGKNGTKLSKREWTQQELIDGGYNTLNTSVYSELQGLSSKIKYDSSKTEFDSCWNDCSVSGVKNVTVEGIGEDARLFQWGMTFKSSSSVEVRNLTFEDYTEDACSFEGGSSENGSSIDGFKTKNFWVHHNTFEEGINYWDVCNEQDKHDGDGSTDFKYLSNVTISYNNYNYTHKTGLIGGGNSHHQASISFHHNYYNTCKSRLPLARQANMHMYNNYYYATTSTDISLRASAYALVENCYFGSTQSVNIELQHDSSNGDGAAKVVGCTFDSKNTVLASGVSSSNLYVGNDRLATVTNTNSYGTAFDTDSALFYYDAANKKSDVSIMFTAEDTKKYVPLIAGVQQRGVDVTLGGLIYGGSEGGETGGGTENPDPVDPVDPTPGDDGADITTTAPSGTATGNISDFSEVAGKTTATLSAGELSNYISDISCVRVNSDPTKVLSVTGNGELKFESGVSMTFTAKSSDAYLVVNMSARSVGLIVTAGNNEAVTVDVSTNKKCYIKLTAGTTYVLSKASGNNDIVDFSVLLPR